MTWSDRLMASLDERATVLRTARGEVQLAREGQGPPVLAIHGSPGGFDQGLAYWRHLRDGGCELLAPSRPGFLRTPLESGRSPEDQADLYAAILDTLEIEQATIAAYSGGGPSAAHFAARHPDRTRVLLLDAAILLPHRLSMSALGRAGFESRFLVWLYHHIATKRPELFAPIVVKACAGGLDKDRRRAATAWITSDPVRRQAIGELSASVAPREYRESGRTNDEANESGLRPIPFADVTAPTLIAHGSNDGIIPVRHAINAADQIAGAELILVEEGHHILPLSPGYGPVAERQLELAHA